MTEVRAFLRQKAVTANAGSRARLGVLALAAALLGPLCALAAPAAAQTSTQSWPQRAVKFILPFGAGSATDVAARLMSDKLSARWGKPVVIENKPGADGLLAIGAFVSDNDDHVLLYASSASFNAHPYMQEKVPYNLERDLAPIAQVTDTILTASIPASLTANTLAEFVALARAEPNKFFAAGAAGVPEFTLGYFIKTQSLEVTKVPYRDIVQGATDLGTGQIQFLLSSAAVVRPLAQAGKVRMLAVTSRDRASIAPDVPTIYEAGFPTLAVETTAGLYGPSSMSRELRERISADVSAVVSDPVITERLVSTGQAVRTGGPEELAKTLREQAAQMATVAKALGLKTAN
jgi:tripartite-type tricarboxylate transporter receptor subunit TctC